MPKWIKFWEVATASKKTMAWNVMSLDGETLLGQVRWFGRWRGYAFFPQARTIFEQQCLRDIADFLHEQTALHRAKVKPS